MNLDFEIDMPHGLESCHLDTITHPTGHFVLNHGIFANWPDSPFEELPADNDGFDFNNVMPDPSLLSQDSNSLLYTPLDTYYALPISEREFHILPDSTITTATTTTALSPLSPLLQPNINDISSLHWGGPLWEDAVSNETSTIASFGSQSTAFYSMSQSPPAKLLPAEKDTFAQEEVIQSTSTIKKRHTPGLRPRRKKVAKRVSCPVCGHIVAGNRDLNRHLKSNHPEKAVSQGLSLEKIKCKYYPTCTKDFRRPDHLKRHLKNKHGGD